VLETGIGLANNTLVEDFSDVRPILQTT